MGFMFKKRSIGFTGTAFGKGWGFQIQLNKDIDGRWTDKGVPLPWFGGRKEVKHLSKEIDLIIRKETDITTWRWWIPYLYFYFAWTTRNILIIERWKDKSLK